MGLVVEKARQVTRWLAVVPALRTKIGNERVLQPVPILIDRGNLSRQTQSSLLFHRVSCRLDAHLRVVTVGLSSVVKHLSQMLHLVERMDVGVRVSE